MSTDDTTEDDAAETTEPRGAPAPMSTCGRCGKRATFTNPPVCRTCRDADVPEDTRPTTERR